MQGILAALQEQENGLRQLLHSHKQHVPKKGLKGRGLPVRRKLRLQIHSKSTWYRKARIPGQNIGTPSHPAWNQSTHSSSLPPIIPITRPISPLGGTAPISPTATVLHLPTPTSTALPPLRLPAPSTSPHSAKEPHPVEAPLSRSRSLMVHLLTSRLLYKSPSPPRTLKPLNDAHHHGTLKNAGRSLSL